MPAPHKDLRELARLAWANLPADQRSAENVRAALAKHGVEKPPSKGSINRWVKEWSAAVGQTAEILLPQTQMAAPADVSDVPKALLDVLTPRLLYIAQGKGLERVENAVTMMADAIAAKAPQLAEMLLDTETELETVSKEDGTETNKRVEKAKVARSAVTALTQLAGAMQTITAARTMVSLAHRNYGEGDQLMAQAHAILESGRAERAKQINGRPATAGGLSAEDEARAALEGTLTDE